MSQPSEEAMRVANGIAQMYHPPLPNDLVRTAAVMIDEHTFLLRAEVEALRELIPLRDLLLSSTVHLEGYKVKLFYGEGAINPEAWLVLEDAPGNFAYSGYDLGAALQVFEECHRKAFEQLPEPSMEEDDT
jgi:hypothetical protein